MPWSTVWDSPGWKPGMPLPGAPLGPMTGPPTTNFYALDKRLQALDTRIVYVGIPNKGSYGLALPPQPGSLPPEAPYLGERSWWDIWPTGKQGVQLAPQMAGLQHLPFEALVAEGAYLEGAIPQRTTVDKRPLKMAVMMGVGEPDTPFRYRMVEQRWWASWSRDEPGYLGVKTRTHGWRFAKVQLEKPPPTVMDLDPVAAGNNFMQWDMEIMAYDPYWQKRMELGSWQNAGVDPPSTPWQKILEFVLNAIRDRLHDIFPNLIAGVDVGEGNIIVPTRGTQYEWPKFLVSSPGQAWIEDGPGGIMVELPLLTEDDGTVLVDTNPQRRTLTATTDPIDRLFYQIARNSQLIDFIMHDTVTKTLPVWRRFDGRFSTPWPARTVNKIKVRHSEANGQVICFMPQRYESSYGT